MRLTGPQFLSRVGFSVFAAVLTGEVVLTLGALAYGL